MSAINDSMTEKVSTRNYPTLLQITEISKEYPIQFEGHLLAMDKSKMNQTSHSGKQSV
jgi:hypothetical protein